MQSHVGFKEDRINAFVCDIVDDSLSEKIIPSSVDVVTLPNGYVLLRDYVIGDFAQVKLHNRNQMIGDGFYFRGDGTNSAMHGSYMFTFQSGVANNITNYCTWNINVMENHLLCHNMKNLPIMEMIIRKTFHNLLSADLEFLGLIIEVGVAFYVFVRFWSSKSLTFLSIPMFITGIDKYGERTWVLWSSNTQRFKNSLHSLISDYVRPPDLFNYEFPYNKLVVKEGINPDDHILVYSYKRLKYLFANQSIDEYHYHSYDIVNGKSTEDAFKLVAIELGLVCDVLYTKAAIVYSGIGISLRCITSISSVSALVLFSIIIDMQSYSLIDITVTYLLLVGAVLLEIYAFILLFYTDRTKLWLVKFKVAEHLSHVRNSS
ncbi:hypothetical protein Q3G72_024843 [Acer saccharum]|nr:hypothetical protein Q3G72_024843 [Acer saccharum]